MLYHLRFLTATGRTLGTVPFESANSEVAIAVAEPHEADGPIEVWSEDVRAAHRLYESEDAVDVSAGKERKRHIHGGASAF